MSSVVRVEGLSKIYDPTRPEIAVRAVDTISFSIEHGESVAIIGPSGCGKSTLLNVLGCLDRPTSGQYFLEGRDVARLGDDELAHVRNRKIGFVFQSFNLLPRMTAVENVELPLLYAGIPHSHAVATSALDRVGLSDRATRLPAELSGGQKQRVAIARALVTSPAMLLCDEPTGQLDTGTGREVLELLHVLNRDGTTLVIVTHDMAIARSLSRALAMRDGRIEADGPSGEVVDAAVAAQVVAAQVVAAGEASC
jgi:putative ABC transport system ATP-binding protein